MRLLRIDFLHCALIAILALLAIYCFRSFREGNDDLQFVSYVSVIPPSPSDRSWCYQSSVKAPAAEKKNVLELLDRWSQSATAQMAGIKIGTCADRKFSTEAAEQGRNGGLHDAFEKLKNTYPDIKGSYMTPMWMYGKT